MNTMRKKSYLEGYAAGQRAANEFDVPDSYEALFRDHDGDYVYAFHEGAANVGLGIETAAEESWEEYQDAVI